MPEVSKAVWISNSSLATDQMNEWVSEWMNAYSVNELLLRIPNKEYDKESSNQSRVLHKSGVM